MDNFYLYGASGHGKVIVEIAESLGYKIAGFIDANKELKQLLDYKIVHELPEDAISMLISIGYNEIRKRITLEHPEIEYKTLIHPNAAISTRSFTKEGTVIMAGVSINSDVEIGKHCIINTNASIDHDCIIEDYVHISPNASLGGNVTVGEGTHVGLGASVIQGITIGKWCTIGAGSVIIRDVPDGVTIVGNPGRILEEVESEVENIEL